MIRRIRDMKNKTKTISLIKTSAKKAKKKTSPPKKSLLHREKKAKKTIKNKPVLKTKTTKPSNSINVEKYLSILESIEDGYFEVDLAGNFTFLNDSVCRTMGYSREELMGMNYRQYTVEENSKIVFQAFNQVYKTGKPLKELGWHIKRKDGSRRYIEGSVSLLKNSSGRPTGFRGIARDITERKQVEKKLINSEEKFRMLAESSAFAIMMHQGDHWIYANRAAEEISGYTAEELYSMHFWDFVHPDYRDMVKQSGYNRQQGKTLPRAYEFKIIAKNGMEKWVSLTGNPIKYEDKPTALISAEDITERKITEASLRESEIKYRRIFESFEDLYYQTDENGIIRVLSPSVYRLTGWSPDELIGKPVSDIYVRAEDREELLAEVSTKGLVQDYELFLKKKDGTQTYASLTASMHTDPDGKPCGIAGTLRDITERTLAESEREAAIEALRKSEHRYLEMSIIDDLTQLYNSRHFYAQLQREIERSNRYGQPLTLLMLDLDKFKDFNDTYGHVQGDYVLSRLGHAIKRSLRETDSAYRYGGEEFTIILPMTVSDEGIVTAKRIQKEFRKENFSLIADQQIYMTVSIGLAQHKPNEEIKTFVHRVDQFMYKVKKTGRGKICSDNGDLQ
jgi:diguanylate cyclase (GGDEF)-like protein/PAS domain S-box-containing protein